MKERRCIICYPASSKKRAGQLCAPCQRSYDRFSEKSDGTHFDLIRWAAHRAVDRRRTIEALQSAEPMDLPAVDLVQHDEPSLEHSVGRRVLGALIQVTNERNLKPEDRFDEDAYQAQLRDEGARGRKRFLKKNGKGL